MFRLHRNTLARLHRDVVQHLDLFQGQVQSKYRLSHRERGARLIQFPELLLMDGSCQELMQMAIHSKWESELMHVGEPLSVTWEER